MASGFDPCDECRGTGREIEIEEVFADDADDYCDEVIAEIPHDCGPCEICEGRGWFPAETPEQREAREAADRQRQADRDVQRVVDHLSSGRCEARDETGAGCYCPWQFHYVRKPGDVRI